MDNNTEVMTDEALQAVSGGFDYVSGGENVQPGGIPRGTHVWSTEWAERGLTKCGLTRLFRESELKKV